MVKTARLTVSLKLEEGVYKRFMKKVMHGKTRVWGTRSEVIIDMIVNHYLKDCPGPKQERLV